jgi:hypothetical protein
VFFSLSGHDNASRTADGNIIVMFDDQIFSYFRIRWDGWEAHAHWEGVLQATSPDYCSPKMLVFIESHDLLVVNDEVDVMIADANVRQIQCR